MKRVIVVGLDGLEPTIVESMMQGGELPNLARLKASGGYGRVQTTYPAQTPVAWSTFATGTNPGGHGIFDFLSRDPKTYFPVLGLSTYEQKNSFLPPKAVNLRRGTPVWTLLSDAGVPSTIIRCPCTYPADGLKKGNLLAGVGVPDLRGGMGTSTFYTSETAVAAGESEKVVTVQSGLERTISTSLIGPRNPKNGQDLVSPITIRVDVAAKRVVILSESKPRELEIREGSWSDWLQVKFKAGFFQPIYGMVRFFLVRLEPHFELYASPINFDPETPLFPISSPAGYAGALADDIGTYYTTGMVEDHHGLNNGRFDEEAFLAQCEGVLKERERMMLHGLERFDSGLFYCLFDTPDRLQHMVWRFREPDHPANNGSMKSELAHVVEDHYRTLDAIVGKALAHCDDETLFITLSDHGMKSFQRGLNVNTWLYDHGLLALKDGLKPGEDAGDFFRGVDWSRTKAYALGLGGIFLNVKGREEKGVVDPDEADRLKQSIAQSLTGLADPDRNREAVRSVSTREQLYHGAFAEESPDLLINFAEGYRVSWGTPLGGVPEGLFEDNTKKWSGDHTIDPALVPGVLFMNRPFAGRPSLTDLAPTILAALGVPKGTAMEGDSLLT